MRRNPCFFLEEDINQLKLGKLIKKQECIPVGCGPSAAVTVCWGRGTGRGRRREEGCLPRGLSVWQGVCPGECLLRGVSAQGGVCPRGFGLQSAQGDVCPWGCLPKGECLPRDVSAHGGVCPRGSVCPGMCLPRGHLVCRLPRWGVSPGGVFPGGVCQTLPLWTACQTLVKTLPCHNYIVDGNEKAFQ